MTERQLGSLVIRLCYRKDHTVPLACGGPDAISNLQWQTVRDAKAKDASERRACAR